MLELDLNAGLVTLHPSFGTLCACITLFIVSSVRVLFCMSMLVGTLLTSVLELIAFCWPLCLLVMWLCGVVICWHECGMESESVGDAALSEKKENK